MALRRFSVPGVELVEVAVGATAEDLERQRVEEMMDLILGLALKQRIQLRGHFADLQIRFAVDIARLGDEASHVPIRE